MNDDFRFYSDEFDGREVVLIGSLIYLMAIAVCGLKEQWFLVQMLSFVPFSLLFVVGVISVFNSGMDNEDFLYITISGNIATASLCSMFGVLYLYWLIFLIPLFVLFGLIVRGLINGPFAPNNCVEIEDDEEEMHEKATKSDDNKKG